MDIIVGKRGIFEIKCLLVKKINYGAPFENSQTLDAPLSKTPI